MQPRPTEVLIVDDDPSIRRLLRHHLERLGMVVREAPDGEAALGAIAREAPSLILLDYYMPGMDGAEVARRIRATQPWHIPMILVTASTDNADIEAAFQAGADDYISKPVNARLLGARICATLRAAELERRARGAERLIAELDDARQVQAAQLPQLPIWAKGWTVTGAMCPCAAVGGDIYAFVVGPEGATALLVDVSGHGAPAALVASSISGSLSSLLLTRPVDEAMCALNLQLLSGRSGRYACVGAVCFEGDDVRITNAGLPPIVLLSEQRVVTAVSGSGTPPGLLGPCTYETVRVRASAGQHIVVMSDGLTEPFGVADAVAPALARLGLLAGRGPPAPEELEERVARAVLGVGHRDDATLLDLWRSP